ncbi:hypothetical protein CNR22_20545 [Sphingobacteriaceae bacterium]|nr:hypothetical protein CNR22_20545 [Sphingobacteriaceae bacterium]
MKNSLFLLPLLLLFSCSVQKRHYQKGYFVSWKKHAPAKETQSNKPTLALTKKNSTEIPSAVKEEQKTELNADASATIAFKPAKKTSVFKSFTDSCDVIIYKNGSEDRIKILEVTGTTIKYKKCSMPDGPDYIVEKSNVFMLKYSNGTNEVFKVQEAPAQQPAQANNYTPQRYVKKRTALATNSLIFGILGFYPLVIIGGIIAIITSSIQLHLIAGDPEHYGAEKKARVGFVLGIVSVILWVALIGLIILAG